MFNVQRALGASDNREVIGLFVAPSLDENTVRTFQRAEFHFEGKAFRLSIAPLTINQFAVIFRQQLSGGSPDVDKVLTLLKEIVHARDSHLIPGEWCKEIEVKVSEFTS